MFNVFKISVFFCFLVLNFNKIDARLPVVPPVHNDNEDNSTNLDCADFPTIKNAALKIDTLGDSKFVQITCDEDYDLFGKSDIFCIRGQWNIDKVPHCEKRCFSPPRIAHGDVVVDQESSRFGEYSKGTLATYSCVEGFTLDPKSSEVRVCENGIWTGPDVECQLSSPGKVCYMPTSIENGFFIPDQPFTIDGYSNYRDKVQYFCEPGYILVGDRTLECSLNGLWMPNIPGCRKNYGGPNSEEKTCDNIDVVAVGEPNYNIYDVMYAVPGQIATVKCKGNYRDALSPCQDSQFRCKKGKWVGVFPICEPAHDCLSPPTTPYGLISTVSYENMNDVSSSAKFPIKSKVTYQCEKGFYMEGSPVMKCSPKGCWNPYTPPICIREKEGRGFFLEVNSINAILISTATGAGVIGILLLVCLVVACRKRKALARAVSLQQPTAPRSEMNDHRVLLQPDRLALIAFAESQAGSQNSLPSYEEAVRHHERNCQGGGGGGTLAVTVNRLAYRPHWPNLASGRRARNSPNADVTHVVRHGSLASHTPSTRSCGDSMGSTDTVGFSEVSTNVTLDTASSHSGSQNPSCRAHCGSLASFDGCSLANTEGVPLLEESELEEIHGGNSNSVDNSGGSDNISSKVSTNSAPVMST